MNCPACKKDSLMKLSDCAARCVFCGAVIVAPDIPMPETYKVSRINLDALKECFGYDSRNNNQ